MSYQIPSKPGGTTPAYSLTSPDDKDGLIPGTQIQFPSKAYRSSCNSYTYRLSELIFGSLLASYILGFLNFAAKNDQNEIFQALVISVTFCYLTAAYYLTYHNSILTMPHIPNRGLRFDFFIAIFQAILFGMSMIWQRAFLIFVASSLASVFVRQTIVFIQLAKVFEDNTNLAKGQTELSLDFFLRPRFRKALKEVNPDYQYCLNGWFPIEIKQWAFVVLLVAGGYIFAFGDRLPIGANMTWLLWIKDPEKMQGWVQIWVYVIILLLLLYLANQVFKRRATHIYVYVEIDEPTGDTGHKPKYKEVLLLDLAATAVVTKLKASTEIK